MNSQELLYWKARHIVSMLSELGISNRRLFNIITRLKIVFNKQRDFTDTRDLPGRISAITEKQTVYFRARGENGECELCGHIVTYTLFNVHLKRQHGLSINFF